MKRGFSLLAVMMGFMLLLTSCSMVKVNEDRDGEQVIAVIGDMTVTKKEFTETLNRSLMLMGYSLGEDSSSLDDYMDYFTQDTLNSLVNQDLMLIKAKEWGLDTLTEEEKANVQSQYDETLETIRESAQQSVEQTNTENGTTMTDAEMEKAIEEKIDAAFSNMYYTRDSYKAALEMYAVLDKVEAKVTDGLEPTTEEIQTAYDSKVSSAKEDYDTTPSNYESAYVNGSVIYYVPDGVRIVQHILISLTDAQKEELSTLRSEGEDEEAVAKRTEYLKEIETKANDVLGKINADHSNFAEVMKEYSADTTTSDGTKLAVAPGGTTYATEFTEAALALSAVGEMSGLVGTDYGYHILLCTDIPASGAVALSTVRDNLAEQLLSDMKTEKVTSTLTEWKNEIEVKTYTERLD